MEDVYMLRVSNIKLSIDDDKSKIKSSVLKKLKIKENQPIILEGIHGLNPILTSSILDEDKFKIYRYFRWFVV